MTYEEFLEALRGHDTIIFRMTGVGEKEYNTIFLVDIAKAVRKDIPTKGIYEADSFTDRYLCPKCRHDMDGYEFQYCPVCGQKIDWR